MCWTFFSRFFFRCWRDNSSSFRVAITDFLGGHFSFFFLVFFLVCQEEEVDNKLSNRRPKKKKKKSQKKITKPTRKRATELFFKQKKNFLKKNLVVVRETCRVSFFKLNFLFFSRIFNAKRRKEEKFQWILSVAFTGSHITGFYRVFTGFLLYFFDFLSFFSLFFT